MLTKNIWFRLFDWYLAALHGIFILGLIWTSLKAQSFVSINGSQLPRSISFPVPTTSNRGFALASFSTTGGGSDGNLNIFLSATTTAFDWPPAPDSTLPTYVCAIRDPSIINWGGTYAIAHTQQGTRSGCPTSTTGNVFFITTASSITTWTFGSPTVIDQSGLFPTGRVSAPEWFPDPQNCTYHTDGTGWSCTAVGNLHIVFNGSTSGGCCAGQQIYETHPTASDFLTNAASWSTAVAITITGEGANPIIDPFWVWRADVSKYFLFYVFHNGGVTSCINWASSSTLTGTYTDVATNQCFGFATSFIEGPLLFNTVVGSPGTWLMCVDYFKNTFNLGNLYCATSTDGFSTWSSFSQLYGPIQMKHGTMIPFP